MFKMQNSINYNLLISLIAILISLISLIWNIVTSLMNDKHKILVRADLRFVLGSPVVQKTLTIQIINASKFKKFVEPPMLETNVQDKKLKMRGFINNYDIGKNQSSIEIQPGESLSYVLVLREIFFEQFEVRKKSRMKFLVFDSLNKKYYSNSIHMQDVVDFYKNPLQKKKSSEDSFIKIRPSY